MRRKEREALWRAIFIISGLSDKEIRERERDVVLEMEIKMAIKELMREAGFEKIKIGKVRVPRYKEDKEVKG